MPPRPARPPWCSAATVSSARSAARSPTAAPRWASSRAGAATTSPACSGSRPSPRARSRVVAGGATREIDVGEINGTRFLGIASCGFDSDANRIANEAKLVRGQLVYLYAALKALSGWKPGDVQADPGRARGQVRGYSVGAANNKAYGGGMYAAPDAELDDGLLDVVSTGRDGQGSLSHQGPPEDSRGHRTSIFPRCRRTAPPRCGSRPTGRSRSMPTATTTPTFRRP